MEHVTQSLPKILRENQKPEFRLFHVKYANI